MSWGRRTLLLTLLFPVTALLTSLGLVWLQVPSTNITRPANSESNDTPIQPSSVASISSWLEFGDLQFESGDFSQAVQSYRQAKKVSVSKAERESIEYRLALAYETLAQFEEAKSCYSQLNTSTQDAFLILAAKLGLCRVLEKSGCRQEARERRCDLLLSGMDGLDLSGDDCNVEKCRGEINHLLAASLGMELFREQLSYFSSTSLVSSGLGFEPQRYLQEWQTRSGQQRKSISKFVAFQNAVESTEPNDDSVDEQAEKAATRGHIPTSDADSLVVLKQSQSFPEWVVSVSMTDSSVWDFFDQISDQTSLDFDFSPTCEQKLKSTKIPLRVKSVTGESVLRWLGCRCGFFWKQEPGRIFIGLVEELPLHQRHQVWERQTHFYATTALLQHPENYYCANSQALLGHLCFTQANWEGAVAHYQKALLNARKLPGQPRFVSGIHFNMAKALMLGGRPSESSKHFFRVIDGANRQDLRAVSWLYLARIDIGQRRFSSAKQSLSKVETVAVSTHLKQIANVIYHSLQILSSDLGAQPGPTLRAARPSRPETLLFEDVVQHLLRQDCLGSEAVDVQLLKAVVALQGFIDSEANVSQLLEAYPHLPLIMAKAYQKLGLPDLAWSHLCDIRVSAGFSAGSDVNDGPLVEMQATLLLDFLDSCTTIVEKEACDYSLLGLHPENLNRWLAARRAFADGRYEQCISLGIEVLKEPKCHWSIQERVRVLLAQAYEKTGDLLSAAFYIMPPSTDELEGIETGKSGSIEVENRK